MIQIKRVYEPPVPGDGARVLVDRVWPRGMRKASLAAVSWLKDVAPSEELRRWFGHDPARWEEFRRRYAMELDGNPGALQPLLALAHEGPITLLYSARDEQHNQAMVLKEYLEARLAGGSAPPYSTG